MGEELSMARSEEARRSVLLAIPSTGAHITTSFRGDEGKEKASPTKASARGAVEDTQAKSKNNPAAKGVNSGTSKSERRRRDYKDRKQGRGDERKNKQVRRSAQELGVKFPSAICDSDEAASHYWVEREKVAGGILFQCKYCKDYLWLPSYWSDAEVLGKLMAAHGRDEGYCRFLNYRRAAKVLVAKMQDLRRLQTTDMSRIEFARLTDKILSDREYDVEEV